MTSSKALHWASTRGRLQTGICLWSLRTGAQDLPFAHSPLTYPHPSDAPRYEGCLKADASDLHRVPYSRWTHVAFTETISEVVLYLDGAPVGRASRSAAAQRELSTPGSGDQHPLFSSEDPLQLGAFGNGTFCQKSLLPLRCFSVQITKYFSL